MEELYMAGNDGELSFLENDGNILLDQGHQGFISSGEQQAPRIIYTQPPQIQYIVQTADPQQHQYTYGNIGATSAYTYSTGHITQAPQQIVQQSINRNEEYSIVQEIQPQHQGILHIVPQHQQIQIPSIVEIPVQHQQQELHVQKQLQHKQNAPLVISQNAQQITFVQKPDNVQTSEAAKSQSTVSVYPSPSSSQQQITLAVQSPSVSHRLQRVQRGGSFSARIQSPPSVIPTSPARPRGSPGQAGQRPRAALITNSHNDNFLKHLEQKTSYAARGKSRGKNTAAQQRKLCSQQINYNIGNNSIDTDISQSPLQGSSSAHDKSTITVEETDGQNTVIPTQLKGDLPQQGNVSKRTEQLLTIPKQNISTEGLTNLQTTKIIHINKEKQNSPLMVVKGPKVYVLSSNVRGNLSGSSDAAARSSISESENIQGLYCIKNDSEMSNTADASNSQEIIPLGPKGLITSHNKFVSRNIGGKFSISENSQIIKKPSDQFVIRQQLQQQQQQQEKKESLVLCCHCGIQTETYLYCSSCKHPLNRNSAKDSSPLQAHLSQLPFTARLTQSEKKSPLRGRGRGRGGRGRGRSYDEPVILTLSSDEEDEENATNCREVTSSFSTPPTLTEQFLLNVPIVNKKEPVITPNFDNDVNSNDITFYFIGTKSNVHRPCVSLKCRSIRIGSYKAIPVEDVEIKQYEYIKMVVPPFSEGDKEPVVLKISFMSILKILGHFNNSLPVFFIYLRPTPAMQIRKQLKMFDRNRFYYNPSSTEESQKRITILPERFDEEVKKILRDQLSGLDLEIKGERRKFFCELDQREANDILVKSSPQDVQSLLPKSLRTDNETTSLVVFPPPPQKGGIEITTDDYCCLEEEQFLNDVILDFYLKYLMLRGVKVEYRERTHVFSTFFYKRLTSKSKGTRRLPQTEEESKLTPAQKRHARVQSWTKNVDIFSKDFILIPINEHSHWFLAVICFPGLDGPVSFSDLKPVVLPNEKVKKTRPPKPKVKVEQIPLIDEGEWSDRDEAEGDEEELNEEDEEEEEAEEEPPLKKMKCEEGEEEADTSIDEANTSKSKESKPPPLPSNNNSSTVPEPIKQPCILIFDSLSGASRSRIVATLRDYLTIEHQKKKNKEKIFTKDTMKGACPKVPQQTNFSDCGLFTLQFAESFFGDPIKDFKLPIKTLNKWFDQDVVAGKRKEIATLIKSLMDEHKPNHNITLPQIHFNSKENAPSGSPDNGENEMKAKDLVQSPGGGDSNQNIKYEEYLQESHQQSMMSHCNRKININLIKRNAANAVAVSSESQINEVANASGGFPHKREVIFNIGPTLGNTEITKGNEISNRGCSKMSVNKINNSAVDQQVSEEDKIGKSPRRIEIKDDADLLLVFNTDPNSQDNSQVTEINIQSSDSSPDFSAPYKSVEESSKSNMSQMFSGASSEDSSKKIFSSGHQTFTPVRNIIYQNTSTGSSSQGMVTTTGALQSTISCASISHEKAKYSSNAKFSKTNHQGLKRHSISGNCTSTQPYLNEEQLLLPGDSRSLHKERLILQQRQQQQKNLHHQQLNQEKKSIAEKSGMKSAIVSELQTSENRVQQTQQQVNIYQANTLPQNQNKINFSQNKQLTIQGQQEFMQKQQLQQLQLLKHKQQQSQHQPRQRELLRQKQQQQEEQIRQQLQEHQRHLQQQHQYLKKQPHLRQQSQDQPLQQQNPSHSCQQSSQEFQQNPQRLKQQNPQVIQQQIPQVLQQQNMQGIQQIPQELQQQQHNLQGIQQQNPRGLQQQKNLQGLPHQQNTQGLPQQQQNTQGLPQQQQNTQGLPQQQQNPQGLPQQQNPQGLPQQQNPQGLPQQQQNSQVLPQQQQNPQGLPQQQQNLQVLPQQQQQNLQVLQHQQQQQSPQGLKLQQQNLKGLQQQQNPKELQQQQQNPKGFQQQQQTRQRSQQQTRQTSQQQTQQISQQQNQRRFQQQSQQGLHHQNPEGLQENSQVLPQQNPQDLQSGSQQHLKQQKQLQQQYLQHQNQQENNDTVHENQNSKHQLQNFQLPPHKDRQRLHHQEQLIVQEERTQQQRSKYNQIWQDQEEEKRKQIHSGQQPKQNVQQRQREQQAQIESVQITEQKQSDVFCQQTLDIMASPQLPNKKLCTGYEAGQTCAQKSLEENSGSDHEEIMQIDNENQCDVQNNEQPKQIKKTDKPLGVHQKGIIDPTTRKERTLETDKYDVQIVESDAETELSEVGDRKIEQNVQSQIQNSKSDTESQFSSSDTKESNSQCAKGKSFQKAPPNVSSHELENITKSKSVTSPLNNSMSPSFSQQIPQISLPTQPVTPTSSSRAISTSSPALSSIISMQTPTPSRTTSRGRVVNTPMKYRDMEDIYVSSKRTRGSGRGSRVRNSRISDSSPAKMDDVS